MFAKVKSFSRKYISPLLANLLAVAAGYFVASATEVVIFDAVGAVITLTEGAAITSVVSAAAFIIPAAVTIAAVSYGLNKLMDMFNGWMSSRASVKAVAKKAADHAAATVAAAATA